MVPCKTTKRTGACPACWPFCRCTCCASSRPSTSKGRCRRSLECGHRTRQTTTASAPASKELRAWAQSERVQPQLKKLLKALPPDGLKIRPRNADDKCDVSLQLDPSKWGADANKAAELMCAENVLVMRDVACAGYVAGCNTLFFAQDSMGGDSYSMDNARTHMMERLSFSNDVGAKYASMLAFPCTAQQMSSGHLDTVMSVTTRLLPWEVTR